MKNHPATKALTSKYKILRINGTVGYRDFSVVKDRVCSSREPRFNSQHSYDHLHLTVAIVPGDATPSSGLFK